MIIPLIALIAVVVVVIYFMTKNAKSEDTGNRPGRDA
jgi:hypothetical protein